MPVADVRAQLTTWDVAEWLAYWRYKEALQDQAIEKMRLSRG